MTKNFDHPISLVIEFLAKDLNAFNSCSAWESNAINPEHIITHEAVADCNHEYCEIEVFVNSGYDVFKSLADAKINCDIQLSPSPTSCQLGLSYWESIFIRSGEIHSNSKAQENAAYELNLLLKHLNKLGNHTIDEEIKRRCHELHPYSWVYTI